MKRDYEYNIIRRKNQKRVKVTVKPGGVVMVSAPPGVSVRFIQKVLDTHDEWIRNCVEKARQNVPEPVKDGSTITLLGQKTQIRLCSSGGTRLDGEVLFLRADEQTLESKLEQYLERFAKQHFELCVDRVYRQMEHLGIPRPKLSVRVMTSRWGSCTPSAGTIRINRHLIKAAPKFHDLVVAHELCHFIHPDHSPEFHALLESFIPHHRELHRELEAGNILNIS